MMTVFKTSKREQQLLKVSDRQCQFKTEPTNLFLFFLVNTRQFGIEIRDFYRIQNRLCLTGSTCEYELVKHFKTNYINRLNSAFISVLSVTFHKVDFRLVFIKLSSWLHIEFMLCIFNLNIINIS